MGGVKRVIKKGLGEMGFNAGGGAINWFPGHMAAATRAIRERLKVADLVVEVRDARIPLPSTRKTWPTPTSCMYLSNSCVSFSLLFEALCLNCTYILCFNFAHLNALLLQFIRKYMLIGLFIYFFSRNGFIISIRASKTAFL